MIGTLDLSSLVIYASACGQLVVVESLSMVDLIAIEMVSQALPPIQNRPKLDRNPPPRTIFLARVLIAVRTSYLL